MKSRHANSGPKRTHGCARCKRHRAKMLEFKKKSGRRYNLCANCAKAKPHRLAA